ncbi:MAG TPA: hypothetical protein VKY74_00785 [Chloroflexia bacterium]|nr:hypothetical protein [Chloroflexia bacterium]
MWEYLSLYAERDRHEIFQVKNYLEPGSRVAEDTVLAQLGADDWELVSVVPAYGGGGMNVNHQLYFKRVRRAEDRATTPLDRKAT